MNLHILKMMSSGQTSRSLRRSPGHNVKLQIMSVLAVLYLILAQVDADGCSRRFTKQVVKYKDCLPKRILTRTCVGSCVTSAFISKSNPFKITHTCSQCKEAVTKSRKIKLVCPNNEGPSPFRNEVININVPQECQCEPCSFEDIVSIVHSKSND